MKKRRGHNGSGAPPSLRPGIAVKSTIRVPLSELKTFPGNPRRGDVDGIAASLGAHGQYRALVVQRSTGRVLAGNHTFQALKRTGAKEALVHMLDVGDVEARRIVLADNRTGDSSGYDSDDLSRLLESLRATPDGLAGTGYDEAYADDLLARLMADSERAEAERDAAGGDPSTVPAPAVYRVVVTCKGEGEQAALIERLTSEGYAAVVDA